jgi:hypothetical protein
VLPGAASLPCPPLPFPLACFPSSSASVAFLPLTRFETKQDVEFVLSNKILGIINCCAGVVPNALAPYGVRYLSLNTSGSGPVLAGDTSTAPPPPTSFHHTLNGTSGSAALRAGGLPLSSYAFGAPPHAALHSAGAAVATSGHDRP